MTKYEQSAKVVLAIAGFDPSAGAGITADIKTIAAHGLYGVACVTALTIQSTQGVSGWEGVRSNLVEETLEALIEDRSPDAVKIGMLGSGEIAKSVAGFLRSHRSRNIVLDPVIRSSSGAELLDWAGLSVLREELIALSDVITPNLAEAGVLTGVQVTDVVTMEEAARKLIGQGARSVVVTGGHLVQPTDLLVESRSDVGVAVRAYPGERVGTRNTHGTGCAFSTSLACNLASGANVGDAVLAAKEYVAGALRSSYSVGKGTGSINHQWQR